jgi:hypothetical protein
MPLRPSRSLAHLAALLFQEYEVKMAAQHGVIVRQQETIRRQEEEIHELKRRLAAAGLSGRLPSRVGL